MKTIVIGLTGPTGAGKSSVAKIFAQNGAKIIDADRVSREITAVGSDALKELVDEFSQDILNSDGSLNRAELAKRAFCSKELTQRLNQITHPHIMEKICDTIADYVSDGTPMVIIDAPLLFESGGDKMCDKTVCVISSDYIRRDRIIKRDGIDISAANSRMKAQPSAEFYTERSDFTIVNDGNEDALVSATTKVLQSIRGI